MENEELKPAEGGSCGEDSTATPGYVADFYAPIDAIASAYYDPNMPDSRNKLYKAIRNIVEAAEMRVLGWAHADACTDLDDGIDYRQRNVPEIIKRMKSAFRNLSPDKMDEQYGESGKTRQELIDDYKRDRAERDAALTWAINA